MKNGGDFVGCADLHQQVKQVIVRIEQAETALPAWAGKRSPASFETENFKASERQLIAKMNAEFAGGKIGQSVRSLGHR